MRGITGYPNPPWWLWPNLLSLDAPLIALCWQAFMHHVLAVALPLRLQLTLGTAVWLIYVLDRYWDNRKSREEPSTLSADRQTPRHLFYREHGQSMFGLALVIGLVMISLDFWRLRPAMFFTGIGLGLVVFTYLILVQKFTRLFHLTGLKEASVGFLFAAGVMLDLFVWLKPKPPGFFLVYVLFALLCTLNCLLIHGWELRGKPHQTPWLRWISLVLPFAVYCALRTVSFSLAIALSASGLALCLLCWHGWRLEINLRRVLVDAALLSPLLVPAFWKLSE